MAATSISFGSLARTEQRHQKDDKTARPKASDALDVGGAIFDKLKSVMDAKQNEFAVALAHWYLAFEECHADSRSTLAQIAYECAFWNRMTRTGHEPEIVRPWSTSISPSKRR